MEGRPLSAFPVTRSSLARFSNQHMKKFPKIDLMYSIFPGLSDQSPKELMQGKVQKAEGNERPKSAAFVEE